MVRGVHPALFPLLCVSCPMAFRIVCNVQCRMWPVLPEHCICVRIHTPVRRVVSATLMTHFCLPLPQLYSVSFSNCTLHAVNLQVMLVYSRNAVFRPYALLRCCQPVCLLASAPTSDEVRSRHCYFFRQILCAVETRTTTAVVSGYTLF